jgi:hypothetical protein
MEDMVTRVAHAIHGAHSREVSPLEMAAARCAIKEMLQPTVEMIDAGNAAVHGTVNADNIYMAMVQEALK